MTRVKRETRETTVSIEVGTAEQSDVRTGDAFLDHMVVTLARYAGVPLVVRATGDMRHHLVEDVAITLGLALKERVPATAARYGWTVLPMDDALVEAAIDLGGRRYYQGPLPSNLYDHFLRSLADNLDATLHVRVIRGKDKHHVVEAAVKAVGLAIRQALEDSGAVFSTKGSVSVEIED